MNTMSFAVRAFLMLTLSVSCAGGPAFAASASGRHDVKDAATADGSVRCGLHNGKIYAVLTGLERNITLKPDSWSSDDEAKNWTTWLTNFDNALFTNWEDAQSGEGQQTVRFHIVEGAVQTDSGRYFSAAGNDASKFADAIARSLNKTLTGAPAMPATKNPLKEITYAATFMCDSSIVPHFGREQLGFMAVPSSQGGSLAVHGRLKDGRAPGIQIMDDKGGGTIDVTDADKFAQKSRQQL